MSNDFLQHNFNLQETRLDLLKNIYTIPRNKIKKTSKQ